MDEYRKRLRDNDSGSWSQEARDWSTSSGLIAGGGNMIDGTTNYMWEITCVPTHSSRMCEDTSKMTNE